MIIYFIKNTIFPIVVSRTICIFASFLTFNFQVGVIPFCPYREWVYWLYQITQGVASLALGWELVGTSARCAWCPWAMCSLPLRASHLVEPFGCASLITLLLSLRLPYLVKSKLVVIILAFIIAKTKVFVRFFIVIFNNML